MAIERKPLRSHGREEALARIRFGEKHPCESINETQLGAELGVNRTPLREALSSSNARGRPQARTARGGCVGMLSVAELEGNGPVMSALEGLALDLSRLETMGELGRKFAVLAEVVVDRIIGVRRVRANASLLYLSARLTDLTVTP